MFSVYNSNCVNVDDSNIPVPPSLSTRRMPRYKRDVVGALDIVTNNAQPIHAEVKPDAALQNNQKPCASKRILPSPIESGVVFQVTAPKDAFYEARSLRKSLPLPNKLDLIRSISRVVTLVALLVSAVIEFYPMIEHLYYTFNSFMYD